MIATIPVVALAVLAQTPAVDPVALATLVGRARTTGSDALVVMVGDQVVADETFGKPTGPIPLHSVTKAVVALGVAFLVQEGKLASLEVRTSTLFPEWRRDPRGELTVRQLLTHSSGLEERAPLTRSSAFMARLEHPPGTHYRYGNTPVILLGALIERRSGETLEAFFAKRLFAPLGIREVRWARDADGRPLAHAGLSLSASDLARLGQLLARGGEWRGQRLLRPELVRTLTSDPSPVNPRAAALFWRVGATEEVTLLTEAQLQQLRRSGAPEAVTAGAARLVGVTVRDETEHALALARAFPGQDARRIWEQELLGRGLRPSRVERTPPIAFTAEGSGGQYLLVSPGTGLVAVRLSRSNEASFPDFVDRALALVAR